MRTVDGVIATLERLHNARKALRRANIGVKRRGLSRAQRRAVFEKTGGLCHYCGSKLRASKWEADHVVPRARAGTSDVANFLPACRECNHLRWHRTPDEFRIMVELAIVARQVIASRSRLGRELAAKVVARRKLNTQHRTVRSGRG